MRTDLVLFIILLVSIVTLILSHFIFQGAITNEKFWLSLILSSTSLGYIAIYFTYVILVKKYVKLKEIVYDSPIKAIHVAIDGESKFSIDAMQFFLFTMFINFASLYFLSITPISSIISKIFEFNFIEKTNLNFELFSLEFLQRISNVEMIIPFTIIGLVIGYVLKCIRRRENNKKRDAYPGARVILGFLYAMLGFMVIEGIMTYEQVNHNNDAWRSSDYNILLGMNFILSLIGIFPVIFTLIIDRKIIKGFHSS